MKNKKLIDKLNGFHINYANSISRFSDYFIRNKVIHMKPQQEVRKRSNSDPTGFDITKFKNGNYIIKPDTTSKRELKFNEGLAASRNLSNVDMTRISILDSMAMTNTKEEKKPIL